jgi:nitrogen-specific signal transduction histidine kinase
VQGIVHGHRGALRVNSSPGAGTAFRVWFPLAAPVSQKEGETRSSSIGSRTSERIRTL